MQVGALAAKRAMEKASERRKRKSFEYAPAAFTGSSNNSVGSIQGVGNPRLDTISSSPDVLGKVSHQTLFVVYENFFDIR